MERVLTVFVCVILVWLFCKGYKGDEANCRVLMDDGVHGNPDHKGVLDGIRWVASPRSPSCSLDTRH